MSQNKKYTYSVRHVPKQTNTSVSISQRSTPQNVIYANIDENGAYNVKDEKAIITSNFIATNNVVIFGSAASSGGGGGSENGTMYHENLLNRDIANQHSISAITNLQTVLNGKLGGADIAAWAKATTKPTYSWAEVANKPLTFEPSAHNHNTFYYAKNEIDVKLATKSDKSHSHTAIEVGAFKADGAVTTISEDLTIFNNRDSGVYTIPGASATQSLVKFKGSGSASGLELIWDFQMSDIRLRGVVDSVRYWGTRTLWHNGNSNLPTANWACKDLSANGNITATGNIVMFGSTVSPGGGSGSIGTMYHENLLNRDVANQHSISAITNLQTVLNGKLGSLDIAAWAKAATKPTYSWAEVANKPTAFTPSAHNHTKAEVGLGNVDNTADSTKTVNQAKSVHGNYTPGGLWGNVPNEFGSNIAKFEMIKSTLVNDSSIYYCDAILMDCYGGSDVPYKTMFSISKSNKLKAYISNAEKTATTWERTAELWHSTNSNLPTANWACKDLSANGNITATGNIVMFGSTVSPGGGSGSIGTMYHENLLNRDVANQHSISAITNLQTVLNGKLGGADIAAWAKATTKPSYTSAEVGAAPAVHGHTKAQVGLANVDNTADSVKTVKQAKSIFGNYTQGGVSGNRPNELSTNTVRFEMTSGDLIGSGNRDGWYDSILMNCYTDSDVPYKTMFSILKSSTLRAFVSNANSTATTWERTAELWHSGNFTPSNYSPITHVHNWSSITEKPTTFTPSTHYHDERYYTESEINTKLAAKSDTSHSHTPLEVNAFKANGATALIPTDLTIFSNRDSGVYTIPYSIASQSLVKFKGTGSASGLELIWDYYMSNIRLRSIIDSNRYGETRTLWHNGNSNLPTANWACKDLSANGNITATGNIVMFGSTVSPGGGSGSIGTMYHENLLNRDVANQHSISAITNLQTVLNGKLGSLDIAAWAKATTKPSYTAAEVGAAPAVHGHTKAQVGLANVDNTADSVKTVKQAKSVFGNYTSGGVYGNRPNELGTNTARFEMTSGNLIGGGNREGWYDSILMNCYTDSDVPYKTMFSILKSSTLRAFVSNANSTATTWERTAELWHTGNFTPSNYSLATHVHNWSSITEKPTTFTPSTHYHDERYYTENEINTKLAAKSDTSHSHTPLEVNAFKANGATALIPTDLTIFSNRDSGVYTIPYSTASQSLVKFKGTGSASGLELIWDYYMSNIRLRSIIDSNRYGETRTLWHNGNSNMSGVSWACKDLTAAGNGKFAGTVVMYSTN